MRIAALVRGGEMADDRGRRRAACIQTFNSARWDALRAVGERSRRTALRRSPSARNCRTSCARTGRCSISTAAGTTSRRTATCGSRRSASRWRPYYDGSWALTRYGWTWHGRDRWAWPTHHYGRWGFTGASWYWIPANVLGPGVGELGRSRRVRELVAARLGRPPSSGSGRAIIRPTGPNYNPWRGWTVVPRDHFGGRRPVRVHAVDRRSARRRHAAALLDRRGAASADAVSAPCRDSAA